MAEWNEEKHPRDRYGKFEEKLATDTKSDEKNVVLLHRTTEEEFKKRLSVAKNSVPIQDRWRVDLHDEYSEDDLLFITDAGSTVAIEPDGNIISVCHFYNDPVRGSEILQFAVLNGGNKLDAFGEKLFNFYVKNGFEPISWTPFNTEYAPNEWWEARNKGYNVSAEPVIFYRYTGIITSFSYEDFICSIPPCKGEEGYEKAKNKRDEVINNEKASNDF